MEILDALQQSYRHTGTIVGGLRPEHAELPTPCPKFDVRTLFAHLVGVLDMFTSALTDTPYTPPTDVTLEDASGTYTRAADANLAAWRSLANLDDTITLPFGTVPAGTGVNMNLVDVQVHGWDLAKATGQPAVIPDELAEGSLEFCAGMLRPEMRSEAPDAPFGFEVDVAADAPSTDRLVAFLGRQP
jgi:uncharacterized protein (TIGR03086 family)